MNFKTPNSEKEKIKKIISHCLLDKMKNIDVVDYIFSKDCDKRARINNIISNFQTIIVRNPVEWSEIDLLRRVFIPERTFLFNDNKT